MSAYTQSGANLPGLDDFIVTDQIRPLPEAPVRTRGAATQATASVQAPQELDPILSAVKQVQTAISQERSKSEQLKAELGALQAKYNLVLRRAETRLREYAVREDEYKSKLLPYQQNERVLRETVRSLTSQVEMLRAELDRTQPSQNEELKKARFELELARSGTEHLHQKVRQLQQQVDENHPSYDRMRDELERTRRSALDEELKLKTLLNAYISQNRSMNVELQRARSELEQYKYHWNQAIQMKRQAERTAQEARAIHIRNRSVGEELAAEKLRRQELEAQLENERKEKHMLLDCLRAAEEKISSAEIRVSELSRKITHLGAAQSNSTRVPTDRAPTARTHSEGPDFSLTLEP